MHPKGEHPLEFRIAALAGRQHGVISLPQLRALGVPGGQVKRRLRTGRLHPLHRGVYAVGHLNLTDEALFTAAVLAIGQDAALSHLSAAQLYGLRPFNRNRGTWVDVSTTRHVKPRRLIRLHTVRRLEATTRDGIPTTTPARTLLDLGAVLTPRQHERAVHEAEVQRLVTIEALQAQLARSPGHHAAARLQDIIADGPAPTRSALEDAMLRLLKRHGLPRPEVNATIGADEVDLHFPHANLVVELDGWRYHGTRVRHRLDARKQARLEAAGLRVMRADWDQVTRTEAQTAQRVRRALGDAYCAAHTGAPAILGQG
jgi:very-short-patch-repair endonuclease